MVAMTHLGAILLFLFPAVVPAAAALYHLNGYVEGLPDREVYLSLYDRSGYTVIDSAKALNGSFHFMLDERDVPGMYRVYLEEPEKEDQQEAAKYVEFVFNRESMDIYGQWSDLERSVSIVNSEENRVLQAFKLYENRYEDKMRVLQNVFRQYPADDVFMKAARRQFETLQRERSAWIDSLTEAHPGLYVSRIIAAYRSVFIPADMGEAERQEFLKKNYFREAPIRDTALVHTPVYHYRIIEYLMMYRRQGLSFAEQEQAFMEAVDAIMANVAPDEELMTYVTDYLIEGFHSFQMEEIQTYILDHYVDELCRTDVTEMARERSEGYRKMAIGETAPDLVVTDRDNRVVTLSEMDHDYVAVVFWSTDCPHCSGLIPRLAEWYRDDREADLEVIAISIDTVPALWEEFLGEHTLPWINANEPLGWKGKAPTDYNVYATPTLFILNRNREILAKPFTWRDFRKAVRDLE